MIVSLSIVWNRTVIDTDWRFYNLCGSQVDGDYEMIRQ